MDALTSLRHSTGVYACAKVKGSDHGLYDVLKTFANGLGYTVSLHRVSTIQGDGDMSASMLRIRIGYKGTKLWRAYVLAHEIAHEYTRHLFPVGVLSNYQYAKREVFTEAVAHMILVEYGFDLESVCSGYIAMYGAYEKLIRAFRKGTFDKAIRSCYDTFSRDFRHFLMDGGTNGQRVHGVA